MVFYETAGGKINVIEIPSEKPSHDTVLCIHGLCLDARIFTYVGTKLSQAGYNVASVDLPGHGRSNGEKGDLDFDDCLKSIDQIVAELNKKAKRVFILAHSLGCSFALWYAHAYRDSIDGLILISPALRPSNVKRKSDVDPSALALFILFLGRLFAPRKRVDITKAFPEYVRVGGDEVAWAMKDPILNFQYSFRYLMDVVASRSSKMAEMSEIEVPVLILHGRNDRNVFPAVSEEFFKLLRVRKSIEMFDCDHWYYDAVFYNQDAKYTEESRMKFISSIVEWLRAFSGNGK